MKLSYQHKRYYVLIIINIKINFLDVNWLRTKANIFCFSLLFLTFTSYGLPDVPFFAIYNPPLLVSAPYSTKDCWLRGSEQSTPRTLQRLPVVPASWRERILCHFNCLLLKNYHFHIVSNNKVFKKYNLIIGLNFNNYLNKTNIFAVIGIVLNTSYNIIIKKNSKLYWVLFKNRIISVFKTCRPSGKYFSTFLNLYNCT